MTAELVAGLVALIVALVGGSVGWGEIKRHGAETERRKQAEGDAREATKQVEKRTDPVPTDRDYLERLRRLSQRLARLRD